jgi:hypothetical protein
MHSTRQSDLGYSNLSGGHMNLHVWNAGTTNYQGMHVSV